MKIFVLNCGSSSVKFQLIETNSELVLAKGLIEEIGGESKIKFNDTKSQEKISSHDVAIKKSINFLIENNIISSIDEIDAFGHRVVHGGEKFSKAVLIDDEVINGINECSQLAPLHNPANLIGIHECLKLSSKPNIAVFDTAFHQTMKPEAYLYPIPYEYYEKYKIRKYGFHGTSHKYVANKAANLLGKKVEELNLITCHLGNGSSLTAIEKGKSVNTTMGFTPLAGLMMGTRCGDIDPAILQFLMKKENISIEEVENILNKKSGLLGLSGISSDCRIVEMQAWDKKNVRAQIALDKLSFRIKECLGAYITIMDGVDAVIFTGGLGENSPETREFVCSKLNHIGIKIDNDLNQVRGKEKIISSVDSIVKIMVIPTNEELMIAKEVNEVLLKNNN